MKTFTSLRNDLKTPLKKGDIMYADRSIGIARQNMPQIASADVPDFLNWISGQGIKISRVRVLPSDLHPTQYDLNADKIAALKNKPEQLNKILIVSKDNRILDGHHRWGALAQFYPDKHIEVERVETDIISLINLAKSYPRAFHKSIHEAIKQSDILAWGRIAELSHGSIQDVTELGWWFDHDPIKLYHGTHVDHLQSIIENGLSAHAHGTAAGAVSMALDPKTAYAWAGFSGAGGESVFRQGSEAAITPQENRMVLELSIPKDFISDLLQPAVSDTAILNYKLQDKAVYEAEKAAGVNDLDYYALTEVRLPQVPAKYITRILTK